MENPTRTRAEHLAWCKARALEYLPGDPQQAFLSMAGDLREHPGTYNPAAAYLMLMLMLSGECDNPGDIHDPEAMRRFIEGYR